MEKILAKVKCLRKSYLNSLNLQGDKEKTYYISVMLKKLLTENDLQDLRDEQFVRQNVEESLEEAEFILVKEKDETIDNLVTNIVSFAKDMIAMGAKVVDKNINVKKKIGVNNAFLKFDLVLEFPNDPTLYLCMIHGHHKVDNCTKSTEVEKYISTLMAQEAFPAAKSRVMPVVLNFVHDVGISFSQYFIKMGLTQTEMLTIASYVDELTKGFATKNSEKTTEWGVCDYCPYRNLCSYFEPSSKDLKIVKREKATSLTTLTKTQEKIMDSTNGIFRILAGAGTGKTTALANKVVALVQNGVRPEDILIITFGEKATTEFKEKLEYWANDWFLDIPISKFNIFNFNTYGDKILKEEFARFGYTQAPELIDSIRKTEIIKALIDSHPFVDGDYINPLKKPLRRGVPSGIVSRIEYFVDALTAAQNDPIKEQNVYREIDTRCTHSSEVRAIIKDYFDYLKANNLITFENQIEALVSLATVGYEDLLEKYAKPHIIVDEFQDTDRRQLQFLKACTSIPTFKSLTICGDDSQSIYAWRGADKEIITTLEKVFPNLIDVKMVENFRSTEQIVDLANKVNTLDENIIPKTLLSYRQGNPVRLVDTSIHGGTVSYITSLVKGYISKGVNLYDIAVIARTNDELKDISIALQKADIPVVVSVSELLRDNPKVKALCNYPRYLLDNEKTIYLAEFLQAKDSETFDKQASIEKYVGEEGEKIKQQIDGFDDVKLLGYYMNEVKEMAKGNRVVAEFLNILEKHQFTNLTDLSNFTVNLRKYRADFRLEKDEKAYDAVTLMTPHAAKGREFKIVIGSLDNFKMKHNNCVYEENQCLFVLITRAMDELVLLQDLSATKDAEYFNTINGFLS